MDIDGALWRSIGADTATATRHGRTTRSPALPMMSPGSASSLGCANRWLLVTGWVVRSRWNSRADMSICLRA